LVAVLVGLVALALLETQEVNEVVMGGGLRNWNNLATGGGTTI
jgi:hypothetical protein